MRILAAVVLSTMFALTQGCSGSGPCGWGGCTGLGTSAEAMEAVVGIALDQHTDAIGGGACLEAPVESVRVEGCAEALTGDEDFTGGVEAFAAHGAAFAQGGAGGEFEPQRYTALQLYVHGKYPFDIGAGTARVYPLAGPRFYHWNPEGCDDGAPVCFESESSVALDVGAGAGIGPVSAEVFTGLGDVPDVSVRLKLRVFGF